jgi:hypothetical protein
MPAPSSFDYAVLRIVPRVDREEFVNAGVIVFCLERGFLDAKVRVPEQRLRSGWPDLDLNLVQSHLQAFARIARGEPDAGPIAQLSLRERFHWLVSPRSTMIQVSPVHSGLCDQPELMLETLFQKLVNDVGPSPSNAPPSASPASSFS